MTTNNCFGTPIFVHDLEGQALTLVQNEIADVVDTIPQAATPWAERGMTSYQTEGCNDLQKYQLDHLTRAIFGGVGSMLKDIGYPLNTPWNLCDSWFNWYGEGDFMFEHLHPERRISGCYYYQTTGADGELKFKNPNPLMQMKQWPADLLRDQDFRVEPRIGRLVLFPSWLAHRVSINTSRQTRISIAFNIA
jgi:uncharacterized protein (TIGR02466 family)